MTHLLSALNYSSFVTQTACSFIHIQQTYMDLREEGVVGCRVTERLTVEGPRTAVRRIQIPLLLPTQDGFEQSATVNQ